MKPHNRNPTPYREGHTPPWQFIFTLRFFIVSSFRAFALAALAAEFCAGFIDVVMYPQSLRRHTQSLPEPMPPS